VCRLAHVIDGPGPTNLKIEEAQEVVVIP
jgi:hypothetical protein